MTISTWNILLTWCTVQYQVSIDNDYKYMKHSTYLLYSTISGLHIWSLNTYGIYLLVVQFNIRSPCVITKYIKYCTYLLYSTISGLHIWSLNTYGTYLLYSAISGLHIWSLNTYGTYLLYSTISGLHIWSLGTWSIVTPPYSSGFHCSL